MTGTKKAVLLILGFLSAGFLLGQLVLGQLILGGNASLVKAHQHSGYTTVVLALIYIVASVLTIATLPTKPKA